MTTRAPALVAAPANVSNPNVKRVQRAAGGNRQRVWLFDLDNTLHDANPHIFPHINRSMREYIERTLGVDEAEATRIRQGYWERYGATLLGLVRHHNTDPFHFLWHTHQFEDLRRMVVFDRALRGMLRRLPGRKIVFSNAPWHYTEAILGILRIRHLFDAVWCIERLAYLPKPLPGAFLRLLRGERIRARQCVFVEDSPANLKAGKRLGMKTVLISRNARRPAFVDLRLQSILDLPRALRKP